MRVQRKESLCDECPLNGRPKVLSTCGVDKPVLALIGEAPGSDEEQGEVQASWESKQEFSKREKGPFIGASGGILKSALGQAGIMWHTVYRMNAISCRPTNNVIDSEEGREAIRCCKPGFDAEIKRLEAMGAKVLVPVGNTALRSLGLDGSISRSRGSVLRAPGLGPCIVPTYHPSFILRGAIREEPTWVGDLQKAKELTLKDWKPPKERFNIKPTALDVETFVEGCLKRKRLVACDIETDGGFRPQFNRITMIGFATSAEDALVVPFMRGGEHAREQYWSDKDELRVRKAVQKLFDGCPLIFQNALFDAYQLEMKGYRIKNIKHDTMLLHHAIHPELPHDLGYIVSAYGETPAWKDVVKGSKARMIEQNEELVRVYNARDCVVLHQVLAPMLLDLDETGTNDTYEKFSMRLVRPLIDARKHGLLIDEKAVARFKKKLQKQYEELEHEIRSELRLPDSFNLDSNSHIGFLLHGTVPRTLDQKRAELLEIEENPKRSKTTKKYLELKEAVGVYDQVKPLYKTKAAVRNADAEAILSIRQAASGRLEAMEFLKRKTPEHAKEAKEIKRLLRFCELYVKWSEVSKMLGTYTNYPVDKDGRVRASLKIHGTATGRLSSSDPNLQNQPKIVRSIFVAEKGYNLIEADYSNLELRVLAYVTQEPFLVDAFDRGLKIHKLNCKLFWSIEEDDPMWDKCYRVTKSVIFGSNYGGGKPGLYKRAMADVPGMELSFTRFCKLVDAYFAKMTKYSQWREDVQAAVTGKAKKEFPWGGFRWIRNEFGRKRFFLGALDEIEREALNTPIQGTAADIANGAFIRTHAALAARFPHARLVMQVHDSFLVEALEKDTEGVVKLLHECMEEPVVIRGVKRKFPVDVKIGKNWYDMTEEDED